MIHPGLLRVLAMFPDLQILYPDKAAILFPNYISTLNWLHRGIGFILYSFTDVFA